MTEVNVREATADDLPRLEALWVEFMDHHGRLDEDYRRSEDAVANWLKYIGSKFENDAAMVFVAEAENSLVGYVGALVRDYPPVFELKQHGFIEEIAVTAGFRRQGIARELLAVAEEWLIDRGIDRITVNIDADNADSQGFFRGRGYLDQTQTLIRKF